MIFISVKLYKQINYHKTNKMERFRNIKNPTNIHSFCRTCLEKINVIQHNILAIPDLRKKFTICTSLPVEPGDGYPTSLCEPCHTKIDDFYNFQQMCISARKQFQDYIDSEIKTCALELATDTNNLQPTCLKKEIKKEQEECSASNDECLESAATDLSNLKSQNDSSSQDEESDDDEPIMKYYVSEEDNYINDKSILNKNEDTNEDINPVDKKTKPSPDMAIVLDCKMCKKIFKKENTYMAHMRVHAGLKPFTCHRCDKSYARPCLLKFHIETQHEGKRKTEKFPCTEPGCDRIMCSKQTLRKHIRVIHSGNGNTAKQPYICEDCGKVLKSLTTLKNHRYQHNGQQFPHECPQCHKRHITKHKLKEHMNRHAGIKKYICPHCGARKSTQTELKTHINYHTKEKTYPCQFCGKVFNSQATFSRHKRVVHEGIKGYPCSYCDKSFGKSDTRKYHEMTHTGEKPYECNDCHKKFIQPIALKKHKKIHHKPLAGQPYL